MSYVRKETVGEFNEDELLRMTKENLDALGIPYEERPGGFGAAMILDPDVFKKERKE